MGLFPDNYFQEINPLFILDFFREKKGLTHIAELGAQRCNVG